MKIIISPAKKMQVDTEFAVSTKPIFLDETKTILKVLKNKNFAELQAIWACNDKIAQENYQRIVNMDLDNAQTAALLSYTGLQYTNIGAKVLSSEEWEYLKHNLYILSGFYGILRPNDAIIPYRLEMQSKISFANYKNLYQFWGDKLYRYLIQDEKIILNLASKEYSKVITPYLNKEIKFITCIFAAPYKDTYKVKATEAKMARGSMVKWCAQKQIDDVEKVKDFNIYGYEFQPQLSTVDEYVFLK